MLLSRLAYACACQTNGALYELVAVVQVVEQQSDNPKFEGSNLALWHQVKILEKTCFQNKSKFITEDYFVQHMNIPIK